MHSPTPGALRRSFTPEQFAALDAEQTTLVRALRDGALSEYLNRVFHLHPRVQNVLVGHLSGTVREALGGRWDLTPDVQVLLAQKGGMDARRGLAGNQGIVPEAAGLVYWSVELLLESDHVDPCASALMRNPSTPAELLVKAYSRGAAWVQRALLSNPTLPLEVVGPVCALRLDYQQALSSRPDLPREVADELVASVVHPDLYRRAYWDHRYLPLLLPFSTSWERPIRELVTHVEELLDPLGPSGREVFVKLLPEWRGTPEELAELAVRL